MKDWHKLKPELFKKQPYHLPACDSYVQASEVEPLIGAMLTIGSVIWSVADKQGR